MRNRFVSALLAALVAGPFLPQRAAASCDAGLALDDADPAHGASAALRVTLVAPPTAHSFSFVHKLHAYEFPSFVCSAYNDVYAVLVEPAAPGAQQSGTSRSIRPGTPSP